MKTKLLSKLIAILLSTLVLTSCAETGLVIQAVSAAANAYSAHKDSTKKVYSKECAFMKRIYLDPEYATRLTEQERRDILTHNEQYDALCGN